MTQRNFSYAAERDMRGDLSVTTVEGLDIAGRCFALELSTGKRSNGIITSSAYVYEKTDFGRTMDLFGDYRKTLAKSAAKMRATEKNLIAIHEQALDALPAALIEAQAFTAAKVAREAAQKPARECSAAEADALMENPNYVGHPMHY